MKTAHSFPLLPLVATLGCSLSAAAEGNAPLSASCSYAASAPATVSAPAKGTNEATAADPADDDLLPEDDADSPAEDGSSALPYFSPRPLPPIFDYWQEVLMEQSEARKYLVLDEDEYNRPLTEDEKAEIEEVRGHIREALAAAKDLFTAQMALIRGPLSHPHYHPNDPYEVEDYLAICEEYLAESFHRDLEALSFCASFMSAGCVEPTLHPGRRPMLSMSEPEVIFRQRIGGESTVAHAWQLDQRAAEWQERQKRFMENYMEHYGDDPCEEFMPKTSGGSAEIDDKTRRLTAQMHKAITVIQFKVEAAIIKRHPEWRMQDRLLLDNIDYARGVCVADGKEYAMKSCCFPTVSPDDPCRLTPEEQLLVDRLRHSFTVNEKLHKHIRLLLGHGSLYTIINDNLLFHASVPLNADGSLSEQALAYYAKSKELAK